MFYLSKITKHLLILLVIFANETAVAQEPPISEVEAQQFLDSVATKKARLLQPVFVHYAGIYYIKVKNNFGDEEDAPILNGYPSATNQTGLTNLELFMEADGLAEACRIILVKPNYEHLKKRMIEQIKNEQFTETLLFKMHLVHELGHCIEYQNMHQTGETGWRKHPKTTEFLINRQEKEAKIWSESFADSFAALWLQQEGYTQAPQKLMELREFRKNKDPNHNTVNALKKIQLLKTETKNICEEAHEARGGEKIKWPACK